MSIFASLLNHHTLTGHLITFLFLSLSRHRGRQDVLVDDGPKFLRIGKYSLFSRFRINGNAGCLILGIIGFPVDPHNITDHFDYLFLLRSLIPLLRDER
jgi:hypothetical protein